MIDSDEKGFIWFKLNKEYSYLTNDTYFCCCYIPPEDSRLYRNPNAVLYEVDFYDLLNNDIRKYSDLGNVCWLGDMNGRSGQQVDFTPDVHMNRYIDIPDLNARAPHLPERQNHDVHVNNFGSRLLNICKENDLYIVNGRKEPGQCTYHGIYRNTPVCSTVDYVIVNDECYDLIDYMHVHAITEFSDHCPVEFNFCYNIDDSMFESHEFDKVSWNPNDKEYFITTLKENEARFRELTTKLISGENDINQCMNTFSKLTHEISFHCFGTKCKTKPTRSKPPKSEWFNDMCKESKRKFYETKRTYLADKTDENKLLFFDARKSYAKVKRNAKSSYYYKEKIKLSSMSKTSPRKFWKYLKKFKRTKNTSNDVSLDDFVKHFSKISTPDDNKTYNTNDNDVSIDIEQLDMHISLEEIQKTISSLKRHKSCDMEGNVADFFIDANSIVSPYLCSIFNYIYDNCAYPDAWCKGVIVPIYKKGNKQDAANYRGVTLVNVLGKIFSLILRNRINKWCESEQVFNSSQFGFRDGRSTADAVFILHAIIQKVLAKKARLWCVFIDYQRAFDTVNREALWTKLLELGVSCKMTNMIKSIYSKVQSCVRLSSSMQLSDFFDVTVGLKQGEPLSPILFILFINDIAENLNLNDLTDKDLDLLSMFLILFADDIVLFTTDPVSLQSQIDSIYQYSERWSLKINIRKTKLCVFEKRKLSNYPAIFVNNERIEQVDCFTYLGVKFWYTGNMIHAVKALNDQALKAYNNLLSLFDKVDMDIKTKLSLFDAMVVPILLYCSEVWGIYNFTDVDKIHIRFCKNILGVKQQTPNACIYGELGRYPLSVIAKERSIKFWTKIMKSDSSPIQNIYFDLCNHYNLRSWATRIHSVIDHLGYTTVLQDYNVNINYFPMLKQRLRDQYLQDWSTNIRASPKLEHYCKFKDTFCFEDYLSKLQSNELRRNFTSLRLGSHKLEIESGRFQNIPRENRLCKLCQQGVVESEFHFLLCCNQYHTLRDKYFGNMSWPTINKFNNIMSCKIKSKLLNTSKFIKEAMCLRKNTL